MNPEDKALMERTLQLSEENNLILRKIERRARWVFVWGFIKAAVIIVPLVIGYLYLQPFIDQAISNFNSIKEFINTPR